MEDKFSIKTVVVSAVTKHTLASEEEDAPFSPNFSVTLDNTPSASIEFILRVLYSTISQTLR
jgi:hypothetical protein